jgi:hypothetical protein
METTAKNSSEPARSESCLSSVTGALAGAALGVILALVPMFVFPQPTGDPGNLLLGATILATFVFGFFGLILGGYLHWRFSQ